MLKQADKSILFNPPKKVIEDYPEFEIAEIIQNLKPSLKGKPNNLKLSIILAKIVSHVVKLQVGVLMNAPNRWIGTPSNVKFRIYLHKFRV